MASRESGWDAELYEARHSFVWELGEQVIEWLNPKPGECILDLGCGTGQLANKISQRGADVVGLDASPEMIGQARQNFPHLRFVLENAAAMKFNSEFDAVFSNAALHWMLDAEEVLRNVARALRSHGRFVAELGGKGNIRRIESAIETAVAPYYQRGLPKPKTFFPSIAEYAALLENCGLEVRNALLFDRPTPLEGADGMENWIRQFKWYYFESLDTDSRRKAMTRAIEILRKSLFHEGQWKADYRRLRVVAVKE